MELTEQIAQFKTEVTDALGSFKSEVKTEIELLKKAADHATTLTDLNNLRAQVDRIQAELLHAEVKATGTEPESITSRLWNSVSLKEMKERHSSNRRGVACLSDLNSSDLYPELKTTIDTAAVGRSTPGILVPTRVPGIIPAARRALRLRDILPVGPCTGDAIEFVKENAFTNAASPQVEASDKAESALTFTIAHEHVHTIAHWIPASRQVLDDFGELQRYVENTLMYGLKLKEETEILSGDALGDHLNGLITQATAYAGTYVAASDTAIDLINHCITEMEVANERPDFLVLNPVDFREIMGTKTNEGGANLGMYIMGSPSGPYIQVPTIWGLPTVVSNSITAGKFLMGDSRMAKIFDRMQARVDVSSEYHDYFVKNLVAIRCEERIALAVFRTTAFKYGSI